MDGTVMAAFMVAMALCVYLVAALLKPGSFS